MYKEIEVKKPLTKLKHDLPYSWDLNIYRGCSHTCQYCFAQYSHKYLNNKNFFQDIFVKTNIVKQLEIQLKAKNWKRQIINIGGVTDSYQPAEAEYKLMIPILRLMLKYKNPIIISTKSSLILRDYDLIKELAKHTYVNVAVTLTTLNPEISKKIEPFASHPRDRLIVLEKFRDTGASIGLHVMPILPYLTDSKENFDSLFANLKGLRIDYVLCGVLYLRGDTRQHYLDFIKEEYPSLYQKYLKLYERAGASKDYKEILYQMVNKLKRKYNLSSSYSKPIKEKLHSKNLEQCNLSEWIR